MQPSARAENPPPHQDEPMKTSYAVVLIAIEEAIRMASGHAATGSASCLSQPHRAGGLDQAGEASANRVFRSSIRPTSGTQVALSSRRVGRGHFSSHNIIATLFIEVWRDVSGRGPGHAPVGKSSSLTASQQ
jgi:hypothetical protein